MGEILLDGVTKVYPNGVQAVDDVNLTIGDGEFMVLAGPSGCGKSTLLRMIAGLEEVTEGTILIGDRDVTELAPRHRDGLSELCALPAHGRGLRAEGAEDAEGRDRSARRPGREDAVFNARVDSRTGAKVGQPRRLAVDPRGFYFFDPDTGQSLAADRRVATLA